MSLLGYIFRAKVPKATLFIPHLERAPTPSPDSTTRFLAFSMVLERLSLRAFASAASFSAAVSSFGLPNIMGGRRTRRKDGRK